MAIDPSISLAYKPVEVPDPLQVRAQQLGLQNLVAQQRLIPGQQQIQQQQIQENALKVQAAQRDANDQRIIPQALFQAKVGSDGALDMKDFKKQAANLGASWSGISKAEQQFNTVSLTHAQMTGEDLDNARKQSEGITESAGALLKMPDADAAEQWPNSRADLITRFHIDPAQIPESYPGKNWLTANYKITAMNLAAIMNAQAHQASAQAAQSHWDNVQLRPGGILVHVGPDGSESPIGTIPSPQGAPQNGVAAPISPTTPGQTAAPSQIPNPPVGGAQVAPIPPAGTGPTPVPVPPATAPGVRVIASNPAPPKPVVPRAPTPPSLAMTASDPNATPAQRTQAKAALLLLAQQHPASMGMGIGPNIPGVPAAQPTGNPQVDAVLAKYPESVRSMAQGFLSYNSVLPSGRIARDPLVLAAQQAAREADPTFDIKKYPEQQKMMIAMTSGAEGRQNAFGNILVGHLGELNGAIDALKNGDVVQLNRLGNFVGAQLGMTPIEKFKTIVNRVAPETVEAYVGSGGQMNDRVKAAEDFNPNKTPDQLKTNTQEALKLLLTMTNTRMDRWKGVMGDKPFPMEGGTPLTPTATAIKDRILGTNQQGGAAVGRSGNPNPTGYIQGHVYGGLTYLGGDPNNAASWKK